MEWFIYLLKVSACLAFFFAFYVLVLRKLTFFAVNRAYLLLSLGLSFAIPAFQFEIKKVVENTTNSVATVVSTHKGFTALSIQISNEDSVLERLFQFFTAYSPLGYLLILTAILLISLLKLIKVFTHINRKVETVNGLKLIKKSTGFTNCSFFNYVFIDEDKLAHHELEILLNHEKIHAKKFHSVDKIVLVIAKAILWFNPVIYLVDKALEEVHEYEADEATSRTFGRESYASLLLKLAINPSDIAFTNHFSKSPIKNRITMLFNLKSEKMKKLTYLLALPMAIGMVWVFSTTVVYAQDLKNEIIEVPMAKKAIEAKSALTKGRLKAEKVEEQPMDLVKEVVMKPTEVVKEVLMDRSFYERYEMIDKDGKAYDEVRITLKSKSSGTAFVPKEGKVIVIINGVKYNENELKTMDSGIIKEINSISVIDEAKAIKIIYPELAGKCNAVIQLPRITDQEFEKLRTKN